MSLFRPTLRLRMALLYGGLVLLVGISLLFTSIVLLDHSIAHITLFHKSFGDLKYRSTDGTARAQRTPRNWPVTPRRRPSPTCSRPGGIFFGIVVVIGTIGGYVLAKQALRPIAKLTQTARALSTETLDQRINLGGPDDELRELADTFDDMLGPPRCRLRQPAPVRGQRLARVAHPAVGDPHRAGGHAGRPGRRRRRTAPHGRGGRQRRRAGPAAGRLAADPGPAAGRREPASSRWHEAVDLAGLIPGVVDAVSAEAAEKTVSVETEIEPAVTLGDPRLLERLIGNLVENAIRHNVPNGWLRITTGQTAERVWLHVANGGALIASADVDALFEPFRRGGRVRTATRGAGLGLAIVRLIVDAHHGKLQAAAPPFGGLAIRIELPRYRVTQHRPGGRRGRRAAARRRLTAVY